MRDDTETVRTIDLGHDQLLVFDGVRDGRVRVLTGATWLTQEREAGDVFLRPGAEVALRSGRTVIEGLEPTRLQIVERAGRHTTEPAGWLHKVWRSVRRQIVRLQFGEVAVPTGG